MKRFLSLFLLCFISFAAIAADRPFHSTQAAGPHPDGYFVAGNGLFKPDGSTQPVHGLNVTHWDNWGGAKAVALAGANVARLALNFDRPAATNAALVDTYVSEGLIPILGNWKGTCKSDPATLAAIVDTWVAQAPTWAAPHFSKTILINIANEWGPPNSAVWRDSNIAAVGRLRAAGYTQTIVIDSGGCGQDAADVLIRIFHYAGKRGIDLGRAVAMKHEFNTTRP